MNDRICLLTKQHAHNAAELHRAGIKTGFLSSLGSCFLRQLIAGQEVSLAVTAPEGWKSLYYDQKQPVSTLVFEHRAMLPLRIATVVAGRVLVITIKRFDPAAVGVPVRLNKLEDADLVAPVIKASSGRICRK